MDLCSLKKPYLQEQTVHKHLKVDDEDGHYIVQPDTPLTDRCEHCFDIVLRIIANKAR